jgi:hypothetical protein
MPASAIELEDNAAGALLLFTRLWDEASQSMTPTLARHVLKLGFTDVDKDRMHELAQKNSAGRITPGELRELDDFVRVADLVGILHAKARLFLKKISIAR